MKGKPALCYSYSPTQTLQSVQYKGFWLVSVMWFSIYVRFVSVLFCLHHLYFMIPCKYRSHHWLLPVLQAIMQPTSSNILKVRCNRCNNTWIRMYTCIAGLFQEQWRVVGGRATSKRITRPGDQQASEVSLTDCYVSPPARTHTHAKYCSNKWSWYICNADVCMPFCVLYSRQWP